MFNSEPKPPSLEFIFKRTSDEKALTLLRSIALSKADRSSSLRKSGLTAKQYYSRISGLMDAGLIKRYKCEYSLTSFGRVVYNSLMKISNAVDHHPKLRTSLFIPRNRLPNQLDTLGYFCESFGAK